MSASPPTVTPPDAGDPQHRYLVAFLVSMGAGLCTAIGAAAVRFGSLQNPEFLALSMALAAGVMLHVSYVEILPESVHSFEAYWPGPAGAKRAYLTATLVFFGGILLTWLLDAFVHWFQMKVMGEDGPHDHHAPPRIPSGDAFAASPALVSPNGSPRQRARTGSEQLLTTTDESVSVATAEAGGAGAPVAKDEEIRLTDAAGHVVLPNSPLSAEARAKLMRTGLITAIAIGLHNLPEGLASFVAMAHSTGSGLPLAVAIAIHNIPEGICVAVPVLYATGSRWKAFLAGTLSGITEPIGAAIGWAVLGNVSEESLHVVYGVLFALVAGIMVYISLVELLPTAFAQLPNRPKYVSAALFGGVAIMAASLVLFAMAG
ncbi:Zinc/iron permease [Catenaria anguillulae PL171]|uniref:Zinc/iron permease n=1 Tax=Catenaria anguillulae PL171 TaxID=765915 RepID=A0A1Y2HWF8_9FUNG|nr:Zinc/iron permease [Catenaria anguillulae PL171]